MEQEDGFTYLKAGVNIDAGNTFVERLTPYAKRTMRPEILAGIGGFGACIELPKGYQQPVLVSSTDGVGTKLLLAQQLHSSEGLGIDLVAMCVNDVVVCGAEPLFFLDYFATGRLNLPTAETLIKSIAEGCLLAGCALVGGETAEMPGLYSKEEFDIAGFCVGVVEKTQMIRGDKIVASDVLVGLPSSGPHANGFSLIRHILKEKQLDLAQNCGGIPLGQALLAPTRIYVKALLALHQKGLLKGAAHITGGGLIENVPRMFAKQNAFTARIDGTKLPLSPVFNLLAKAGSLSEQELLRTFNCGVGMVVCISQKDLDIALQCLKNAGESPFILGHVETADIGYSSCVVQDFPYGQ